MDKNELARTYTGMREAAKQAATEQTTKAKADQVIANNARELLRSESRALERVEEILKAKVAVEIHHESWDSASARKVTRVTSTISVGELPTETGGDPVYGYAKVYQTRIEPRTGWFRSIVNWGAPIEKERTTDFGIKFYARGFYAHDSEDEPMQFLGEVKTTDCDVHQGMLAWDDTSVANQYRAGFPEQTTPMQQHQAKVAEMEEALAMVEIGIQNQDASQNRTGRQLWPIKELG